jgi:tellurite resistance protein
MHTFNPDRTIVRAEKVLPMGGWKALDQGQRKLILRAAWVVSEADGPVSKDELTALDQLAHFLGLGTTAKASGVSGADRGQLLQELRDGTHDRAFARHLYAAIFLVGMSDGVLLDSERAVLHECSHAVGVEAPALADLEADLHGILYEELLETVFKDGVVSARERQILNATRKLLGLSEETGHRIEEAFRERLVRGDMGAY